MLLYLLIPLFLAACSPLSAPAPVASENVIVVGNTTVTHTPTTSFTRLRKPIKPAAEEITWLKSQTEKPSPTKLAKPKKTIIQTQLVTALKQQKAQRLLIEAEHADDSFSLRIQVLKGNKTTCTVQTLHPTCPAWVKMVIKQSLEQVIVDAKRRQRQMIGGGISLVVVFAATTAVHKHNEERRRVDEIAATRQRQAIEAKTNPTGPSEDVDILTRYEESPSRTNDTKHDTKTATEKELKKFLTTTPFFYFVTTKEFVSSRNEKDVPETGTKFNDYCLGHKQACFQEVFELKDNQWKEFFHGSFKETTIDLLAQFQRNYAEGKRRDGDSATETNLKATALGEFIIKIRDLQTSDPIEAKRVLCFHPRMIWEKFNTTITPNMKNIMALRATFSKVGRPSSDWPTEFGNFKAILQACTDSKLCLKDFFPREIALFEGLHLVSASAD